MNENCANTKNKLKTSACDGIEYLLDSHCKLLFDM